MKRPYLLLELLAAGAMGALAIRLELSPWPAMVGMFCGTVLYRLDRIIELLERDQ